MNEARAKKIKSLLKQALKPTHLNLVDESHLHVGHAGAQTGLSHYALAIESPLFDTLSLLERHRLIYESLGSLMQTDIHALRIISPKKTNP